LNEKKEFLFFFEILNRFYFDKRYSSGSDPSHAAAKCICRRSYLSRILYSGIIFNNCFKYFEFGFIAAQ
jgi:hypothetical protein